MDPTAALTRLPEPAKNYTLPPAYTSPPATTVQPKITVETVTSVPPINVDATAYQHLAQLKDTFANVQSQGRRGSTYDQARDKANPFEYVGRSIFLNRAAIKLANTDAVYNVTQHLGAFANKQTGGPFTFCDIAAGPGGFTQYIQWRRPDAMGYGMTLKDSKLDWDRKNIDMTRFMPIYGTDDSGNLYTQWQFFVNTVRKSAVEGADLVTGDGGFDVEESKDYARQEFLSGRLLLTQILVGLAALRPTGSFVCKVFDTVTSLSADLLYVCTACFEEVTVFKPVSSRPANTERYIVALRRRSNEAVKPYIDLLAEANTRYDASPGAVVTRLFGGPLPSQFEEWLTQGNMASLALQKEAVQNILDILAGRQPNIPKHDLFKCLLLWNLPDNPIPPRGPYRELAPKLPR